VKNVIFIASLNYRLDLGGRDMDHDVVDIYVKLFKNPSMHEIVTVHT
jgi:hypothetical protein